MSKSYSPGNFSISPHAIERYRERIMHHRKMFKKESSNETSRKIRREVDLRNVIKTVMFGDKFKFIFTKSHNEFRFEKSNDGKFWILVTCIKHTRLMASEEPINIEDISKGKPFGVRTAIRIRELQKVEWEKEHNTQGVKLMNEEDLEETNNELV